MGEKTSARLVAGLFITTMVAGMVDVQFCGPLLLGPPEAIVLHPETVYFGVFLSLFMGLGIVGIALLLVPILQKRSPLVAQTYLVLRTIECMCYVIGILATLFTLTLSSRVVQTPGLLSATEFDAWRTLALAVRNQGFEVAMVLLGFNSLFLCGLLYRTRLVPRGIAATGFVGYFLLMVSAVLDLTGLMSSHGLGGLLYVPGGLFEVVLFPGWLAWRGFRTTDPGRPTI